MATEPQSTSQEYPPSKRVIEERRVCDWRPWYHPYPQKTPQAPTPAAQARRVGQSSGPSLTRQTH